MHVITAIVLRVIKRGILHVIMPVVAKILQENNDIKKMITFSFHNGTL